MVDPMLDLHSLKRPASPNHHLIAPEGFAGPQPDEPAPTFDLPAPALYALARRVALAEPRVRLLEEAPERLTFEARQRTPVWRLADDVTIEVLPLGDSRATLALYSRSRCGRGDFGVNRRRARRWLEQIVERAAVGR